MKWDYVRCKGNYQSNFLNSTWLIDFIIYYFLFYNATVLAQSTLKYFTTIYYWNNKKKLEKKTLPKEQNIFPHFFTSLLLTSHPIHFSQASKCCTLVWGVPGPYLQSARTSRAGSEPLLLLSLYTMNFATYFNIYDFYYFNDFYDIIIFCWKLL